MKRKNGFTLIELLAIIVILAIIALIAVPVVLNIIDKARESSYARSADNILSTARLYFSETQIDDTKGVEGNIYDAVIDRISGKKPDSGEIFANKSGQIALAIKYDKYCYKKGYADIQITQSETDDCTLAAELDENEPIITANETSVTITEGDSNEITSYFTIESNGASEIKSTECTSDKDGVITNTSSLSVNTHTITCTATKNNDKSATTTISIVVSPGPITIGGQEVAVVTTGDGLYLDDDGVYRYKGANPSNYIMLGEEEYRILAIEPQGIKVIRSSNVTTSAFDKRTSNTAGPRNNSNNTYCQVTSGDYYGCNMWTSASEILQNGTSSTTIINGSVSGTVTANSTVYTYLHDTYYSNLSSVQQYIVENATWNVGPVTQSSTMLLDTVKDEENNWTWSGKIGLMTVSEYIQAQSPSSSGYSRCSSNVYQKTACGTDNWLNISVNAWTMNPETADSDGVWCVHFDGDVNNYSALSSNGLRPVVYLASNIQLTGNGTQGSGAFTIVES